jgi:porin
MRSRRWWAAILFLLFHAQQSSGQDQAQHGLLPLQVYGGELAERAYLTGDWGGTRDQLAARGLSYQLISTQTLQGVTDGGLKEETAFGGKVELLFNFDLDRMGVLPGGLVTLRTESRYGNSVNRGASTLLSVNDVLFFPDTDGDKDLLLAVTELRYTQFFSTHMGAFLGKIITLGGDVNEFAGGRGDTQFMSHSFLASPVTALVNPYSAPGAGLFWMPTSQVTVTSSMYARTDSSTTSGLDTLDEGLTWSTAARNQYELNELPGGMNLAFQYSFDGSFIDTQGQFVDGGALNLPNTEESWNAFWNMWQYVSVKDPSNRKVDVTNGRTDLQGLGFFLRAGIADRKTNPVAWSISAGLAGRGVIDGRDNDTFGVGFAGSGLRDNLLTDSSLVEKYPSRWEAYYRYAMTPAVELSLDLQYVDSLLENIEPATIIGLRLRAVL